MDADELARITATLLGAVAEAKSHASQVGIDDEFREILQHCCEMHDLLVEAILALEPDVDNVVRGFADRTSASILQLEAMSGPQGTMM